jgi:AraC family transcriptional regulator, regulatory protein of adaptative response / methylated-DNA-[protein]-cysteine methyltransferase
MSNSVSKDYKRVEKVIRYLDTHHRDQPSLSELSKVVGLSQSHFHRLFSRWAGITPKDFLKALTASHAKDLLRESKDIMSVSFDVGLSGPGRLHDLLVTLEGVSPGEFKVAGRGLEIRYGFHDSPFGKFLMGLTHRGICYLAFGESKSEMIQDLRRKWPEAELARSDSATAQMAKQVFDAKKRTQVALFLDGTPFQIQVWSALLRIPHGKLTSYGDLAGALGKPGAARAVGSAVAANSIAYLIPCHRVIRESGVLGDYRWDPARKKAILAWESA